MAQVLTLLRIVAGTLVMAVGVAIQLIVLTLLLPSRNLRIRSCNYWGKVVGRIEMWISGCPMAIEGWEHLDRHRPAIYVCNHTSPMDAFLAMFLSPVGTVGVVKKSIIWYPFFGQMYLLSGHLRIDRANRESAIQDLSDLARIVKKHALSVYIWPEGTRSRDGRLGPFKKGVVHMALATGLPVVPIVVTGAHRAWEKGGMKIAPVPIAIRVLPAIPTAGWTREGIDEHLKDLHDAYRAVLPPDQQPA